MVNISVSNLAQSWYHSGLSAGSGDPSCNKLFEMLYNAYCRRNSVAAQYSDVTDHNKACTTLYRWYAQRYGVEFNMKKGTKGQKRSVNYNCEDYTFDLLFCDDRQFKNYLLSPLPQSGTQDLLAFVLHTSVAFLVPLNELDHILQHLGFHPLHVKNIHHLAIAYVLLKAEKNPLNKTYNPFVEIRELYFSALQILDEPDTTEDGTYSFADNETRIIRKILLLNKALASQNFQALVAHNRAALNMRHSLILSDFRKLTAVFKHIYDSNTAPDYFGLPEEAYSFYCFIIKFCKEDLLRKKFRENLTGMINKLQKHPTRNVLILLWLFTYCFAFVPNVAIEDKIFVRIRKALCESNEAWGDEADACYHDGMFDIFGFITNQPHRCVSSIFRGADVIANINEKLLLRYGWGVLNDRLPFDHYILKLKSLVFEVEPIFGAICSDVQYENYRLAELDAGEDNVPAPLVVINQLFDALKELHVAKASQSKYKNVSRCPLECSLYEQL